MNKSCFGLDKVFSSSFELENVSLRIGSCCETIEFIVRSDCFNSETKNPSSSKESVALKSSLWRSLEMKDHLT